MLDALLYSLSVHHSVDILERQVFVSDDLR